MKVLWVCNTILPQAAEYLNIEGTNKEGWIAGLAERLLKVKGEDQVQLAVACPMSGRKERKNFIPEGENRNAFWFYTFEEDVNHPEKYSAKIEDELKWILEDYQPDVVHCFGTEFPHTLALTKVFDVNRLLLGFQGVCGRLAEAYYSDLPQAVIRRVTFRDFVKRDDLRKQKKKFEGRSRNERIAVSGAKHVTGRTLLDKKYSLQYNPNIQYHFMNETLRSVFYEGKWNLRDCEPHSMIVSQGDYPLKGLHYAIKAMPYILEKHEDSRLYVAGNPIVREKNLVGSLKVSSYGKYIMELIESLKLEEKVVFLGKLNAAKMKEALLKCSVFVGASAVENSPNALGEAMLLGVPCVTSWVGGVPSVFRDGVDGIGYPGYEAEEYQEEENPEEAQAKRLAEAVLCMWQDKEQMLRYGENASAHAKETHDGQVNFQRLLEIYREMIGL